MYSQIRLKLFIELFPKSSYFLPQIIGTSFLRFCLRLSQNTMVVLKLVLTLSRRACNVIYQNYKEAHLFFS